MSQSNEFKHVSVLLDECIEALAIKPNGIYIDATFGRGGHSAHILDALGSDGSLIAFDRDPQAIEAAKRFADDSRFRIIHSPFGDMAEEIRMLKEFYLREHEERHARALQQIQRAREHLRKLEADAELELLLMNELQNTEGGQQDPNQQERR